MADESHVVWGQLEKLGNTDTSTSQTLDQESLHGVTFKKDRGEDSSGSSPHAAVSSGLNRPDAAVGAHQICNISSLVAFLDSGNGNNRNNQGNSQGSSSEGSSTSGEGNDLQPQDDSTQELVERILRKHGFWSTGTMSHGIGRCRACVYFNSRNGCRVGSACVFCHIPHTSRSARSLSMWRRIMCKRLCSAVMEELGDDPDAYRKVSAIIGAKSPQVRAMLEANLESALAARAERGRPPDGLGTVQAEMRRPQFGPRFGPNPRRNIQSL